MTELAKVKSASKMDAETFLKHMNGRHAGAAGINHFGVSNVPDDADENLLRAMHDHLHTHRLYAETKHQTTHVHGRDSE